MTAAINIPLHTNSEQNLRLEALQRAFTEVCNALTPIVQQTRCWNRVALHHLAYHNLRERFPHVGSQMVCNAIYSVSRISRAVFQSPGSPWHIQKHSASPLPLIQFQADSPVYFDRHTLSFLGNHLSMYTLDGRIRFEIQLQPEDRQRFASEQLREIVLLHKGAYELSFRFNAPKEAGLKDKGADPEDSDLPEYIIVHDDKPPMDSGSPMP